MLVTRWQAPMLPTNEQIKLIFESENLSPSEESLAPNSTVGEHRHPFDEIRVVTSGKLFMNISGNHILLREGDRIDIPANTRHSFKNDSDTACVCIIASRPF